MSLWSTPWSYGIWACGFWVQGWDNFVRKIVHQLIESLEKVILRPGVAQGV